MHWRQPQDDRERAFVEHFLELWDEEHNPGSLRNSESPDLLLTVAPETIGIEVREVFRESNGEIPIQAREGARQSVLLQCEQEWDDAGNPKIEVWLGFQKNSHIPKTRVPDVAQRILELVEDNLPSNGDYIRVHAGSLPWCTFPEELREIRISRLVEYSTNYWHVDGVGGWVPELSPEKVQQEIDAKNDKLRLYQQKASTNWLLLVLHGWRVSSMMDVTAETKSHRYTFDFDRVFLLDTLAHEVHELSRGV